MQERSSASMPWIVPDADLSRLESPVMHDRCTGDIAGDAGRRCRGALEADVGESWRQRDVEAITALYAPSAAYRALAFRRPDEGIDGVRRYLHETFSAESDISCHFGQPMVSGSRAASNGGHPGSRMASG